VRLRGKFDLFVGLHFTCRPCPDVRASLPGRAPGSHVAGIDVRKLVGPFVSVHRLVLFFSNVYRFSDPPVHRVAFSVDHLGAVVVYDVVQRDGVFYDCRLVLLCCCGFAGASCVSPYMTLKGKGRQFV